MPATASTFSCGSCNRKFSWSEELAGKKVRCKCGQPVRVPGARKSVVPPTAPMPALAPKPTAAGAGTGVGSAAAGSDEVGLDENDLYALVADAESASKSQAGTIRSLSPSPVMPLDAPSPARVMVAGRAGPSPLGYQRGPTARERDRAQADTLLDMTRDVHVPLGMLVAGMLLYVGFYVARYNMGAVGIVGVTFGLTVVTTIQAAVLFGFAVALAGPLGVGFGNVWTAFLKFAGTAMLCDGVTIWAHSFTTHLTGGLGATLLSWPAGLAIYLSAFSYLFSLDAGEALTVVVVIRVLDFVLSIILVTLLVGVLFGAVLGASKAMPPSFAGPTFGASSAASATPDPLADRIAALQGTNLLIDARTYAKANEAYMNDVIKNLTAHGAKHVWFEVTRDINLHPTPLRAVVELPDSITARARCLRDMKAFYDSNTQIFYNPADLVDKGRPYVVLHM